tara:strand:- start:170 stop:340 length:171 start_codon:yes stop_codon:yes gene_type:complete
VVIFFRVVGGDFEKLKKKQWELCSFSVLLFASLQAERFFVTVFERFLKVLRIVTAR